MELRFGRLTLWLLVTIGTLLFGLASLAVPFAGSAADVDEPDVALLFDSSRVTTFDINFCKLAEYYGLVCRKIALDQEKLTADALRDGFGRYFKLVALNADWLERQPKPLGQDEIDLLNDLVANQGVNLLVAKVYEGQATPTLAALTGGAVTAVGKPNDSTLDWTVSSALPELTREFTGQRIADTDHEQRDRSVVIAPGASVTEIIKSTDDAGDAYPIFVRWQSAGGSVFVDAGEPPDSLDVVPFRRVYYRKDNFSQLLPTMFVLRFVLGEETWHTDRDRANLTIDDPALTEPFFNLSFPKLYKQMKRHDFHTTIAFPPHHWMESQDEVIELFMRHPDRFSLVFHGNNEDGYEFYKYSVESDDEYEGMKLPARPFREQQAAIREAVERMEEHGWRTGIPSERVMVFPVAISPEPTLVVLKEYNFLATVNAQDAPLGATRPDYWDYGMQPANMDYAAFPVIQRRFRYSLQEPLDPQKIMFELFLDKPALFYTHQGDIFDSSRDYAVSTFSPIADVVNGLVGDVEWGSLAGIVKRLHRQKINDDGTVSVQMYARELTMSNDSDTGREYTFHKVEDGNVPISRVTLDGAEYPYHLQDGSFILTASIPAHATRIVRIDYSSPMQ